MTPELATVLVLLAAAVAMFALNKPRMDAVALIVLTLLPFVGTLTGGEPVVTINQALAGFSDPNIVLIAALFVLGDGLVRTGVARQLGDWLLVRAGSSETLLLVLLMVVVCGLGATMSSTAVTAIFIPVALRIAQRTGTAPSRLMMPISVAALISGMTTLVATAPNLVVNSELERRGVRPFGFFAFTPFGAPILALGIVYMIFARRWMPERGGSQGETSPRPGLADLIEKYKLAGREYRVRVTAASPLLGKTLEELRLRDTSGASLVAIERQGQLLQPTAKTQLLADDVLLIDLFAPAADVEALRQQLRLEMLPLDNGYFSDHTQEIGMAEVIVPADSDLVGKTVAEARVRDRTGLTVIGLRRGLTPHERGLHLETLKLGDTLLLIGPWKAVENLNDRNLVLLNVPAEIDEVLPVQSRAPHAVGCLLLVVALMVSGLVPNVHAALIGCLLMGALGCVTLTSAYRAIDWKTIVLIVGMLPFSIALQKTGGVELAAEGLRTLTAGAGTHAILATLFALTALLGMFISNTATAVLMAPVAVTLATDLRLAPQPFAMIVALAASTAFMTPVSSPVNTLVVTPGNYTFGDFVKVGVPFALIVLVVSVVLVPWLLPLYPH